MSEPTADQNRKRRLRIVARGRVQGVGFRPTFYRALTARGCGGHIRNTPEGVVLEVEGEPEVLDEIVDRFRDLAPGRARVDELAVEELEPQEEREFRIIRSAGGGRSLLPIPPDLAICGDCLAELRDPDDRRFAYPFNTCTACGPRFSIAEEVPFDRETNTMREFPPCEDCRGEYSDPTDRRLHAQTLSCPDCGPQLTFLSPEGECLNHPLERARRMLGEGCIIAVKGVGGFHLACDATGEEPVARLRESKARPAKPFALMVPDLAACRRICHVSAFEQEVLTSPRGPIVLLRKANGCPVAELVAPGLAHLGVMLPYTPLHVMLWEVPGHIPEMPEALVMTSCNRADEPIALTEEHVLQELGDIVDGVLTHDRRIANRCDDSVVAPFRDRVLLVRRSRGYVPEPVVIERECPPVLATGGMNKVIFALTSGRRVFLSQHIGDVADADSAAFFALAFEDFSRLLRVEPEAVVCDLHPDYPTTEFARDLAEKRGLPLMQVQHHFAHVVGLLAEHRHPGPVIGVSWDGSGYGEDGTVWGGEFLVADRREYARPYHLQRVPLPGGEQAILHPDRTALSHLARALGPDEAQRRMGDRMGEEECERLLQIMERERFSPPTSSAGRLFDAVSALLGVCDRATYEGRPAVELEALCYAGGAPAVRQAPGYDFGYDGQDVVLEPLWRDLCQDLDRGVEVGRIAVRFHATAARIIVETCRRIRAEHGLETVALSGGVIQNRTLLGAAVPALREEGFQVLLPEQVPPNDAGISFGQAAWAAERLSSDDESSPATEEPKVQENEGES